MENDPVLLPIPGERIDPPVGQLPLAVRRLESRPGALGSSVGVATRAMHRFSQSRATLLAAGTTYYVFLALFSIIAFAYGLTALLGAEQLSAYVTEALAQAFPGLVGQGGIDPEALRSVGQTTSVVSGVGLLYGAVGAVLGASRALHAVYGAPKNPRNFVLVRLWSLGWLLVLAPLVLVSFVATTFTANLADRILTALGVTWEGPRLLLTLLAVVLTAALDVLIVWLLLGRLGGIRPARVPRLVGALVGAAAIEALKQVMALVVGVVIDKPQYGAFAAPIGILFVLYLQASALYAVASLTAALAEVQAERAGTP